MAIVPTIRVVYKNGGHSAFINVSDFDPTKHDVFVDPCVPFVSKADATDVEVLEDKAEETESVVAPTDEELEAQKILKEEQKARRAAAVAKAQAAAKAAREKKKADKAAAAEEKAAE